MLYYDDLLDYATNFEFGTDLPDEMHISFQTMDGILEKEELFEDYAAACVIRAARGIFALLPVEKVHVVAENNGEEIINAMFSRKEFEKIKFSFSEPIDILNLFI